MTPNLCESAGIVAANCKGAFAAGANHRFSGVELRKKVDACRASTKPMMEISMVGEERNRNPPDVPRTGSSLKATLIV